MVSSTAFGPNRNPNLIYISFRISEFKPISYIRDLSTGERGVGPSAGPLLAINVVIGILESTLIDFKPAKSNRGKLPQATAPN